MTQAMCGDLVDVSWLNENYRGSAKLRVLDSSWHLPREDRDANAEYRAGRIPGAGRFDIDRICDREHDMPHMLPPNEVFEAAMARLGIGADTSVVVYENRGLFAAARAWWMFRYFGHSSVAVLDGGLPVWRAFGGVVESGEPNPTTAPPRPSETAAFVARPRPELLESLDAMKARVEGGQRCVLDARAPARFAGESPEPREGLRSGHMPGARNLHFASLVAPDGRMLERDQLRARFTALGISLDDPITCSCGSGVTACVLALALYRLGKTDVSVFDGSWTQWGTQPDTLVVTGV